VDLLKMQRLGRQLKEMGVPILPDAIRKMMRMVYQTYIPYTAEIGEGTRLGYNGLGILIHPRAKIGSNCILSPFVIIGGKEGLKSGAQIGEYVRIGAGAKILGPVKIGDFAVIGANAVVTRDVAAGTVVAGIPAKEIRRMEDPASEYENATGRRVPPHVAIIARCAPKRPGPQQAAPQSSPPAGRDVFRGDPLELGVDDEKIFA
jgi:serine O-acetyltransferase